MKGREIVEGACIDAEGVAYDTAHVTPIARCLAIVGADERASADWTTCSTGTTQCRSRRWPGARRRNGSQPLSVEPDSADGHRGATLCRYGNVVAASRERLSLCDRTHAGWNRAGLDAILER